MLSIVQTSLLGPFAGRPRLIQPFRSLSVCIIGSGPAGFYTAQRLLKRAPESMALTVDMIEKLPAPYGLVRYGVAPDHPEVKNCSTKFEALMTSDPRLAWFGGISLGGALDLVELRTHYDAVVLAIGAQRERQLGIPGESLDGVYSSQDWTRWINGYPNEKDKPAWHLVDPCTIIGHGNVALDVARLLLSSPETLGTTDISDLAYKVLAKQSTRHVQIMGRRGPAQVSFTAKELRELFKLCQEAQVPLYTNIERQELVEHLAQSLAGPRPLARVLDLLSKYLTRSMALRDWSDLTATADAHERSCMVSFFTSPTAFLPDDSDTHRVGRVVTVTNQLAVDGSMKPPSSANKPVVIRAGSIVKCVGYEVTVPGLSASALQGSGVRHDMGRVSQAEPERSLGLLYASGWAKRGASGVLATTMNDAFETADTMLSDFLLLCASSKIESHASPSRGRPWLLSKLKACRVPYVTFEDWLRMDAAEVKAGELKQKPREKITSIQEMIDQRKIQE